ncbi:MAG TPA: NAD-dependent epimerase/dehydratase family protein, partial [Longimicrobium sp.]|nr:NAD-dependent epimerase/dehydratase family protein [Longimicrobium sp.]
MEILVLGGTRFVGRKIAEAALERGHRVTLFNRGVTDPQGVPGAEQVAGDRTVGLDALAGRRWDAVIDTSSSVPANVRRATEALAGAAGRYVFVSTISVYPDFGSERIDEDAPVHAPDFDSLRPGPWSYGPMKAACETIVRDTFGGRALVVRPGTL